MLKIIPVGTLDVDRKCVLASWTGRSHMTV